MWLPLRMLRDWKRDPDVASCSPARRTRRPVIWTSLNDPSRTSCEHDASACSLYLFTGDVSAVTLALVPLLLPRGPHQPRSQNEPLLTVVCALC